MINNIISIIAIIAAVWVIYDVITTKKNKSTGIKAAWIIAAILFSIITAIIYYLVEKK